MKSLLKKVYKVIPFKQQVFSLVRKMGKVPHSIHRHLYFDGVISYKVNGKKIKMNQKGYDVENTLFWAGVEGCWEKVSIGLWIRLCKDSNTILDIGANTGTYALVAKTVNEKANVIAFEPLDFIFTKLTANAALNKLDIRCMPYALSDFNGTAKVYAESLEHLYSVTVNKNLGSPDVQVHETEIAARKLSTIINEQSLSGVDLMKIDVEHHEAEVLKGMEEYLNKWRPVMLIEILTDEVGQNVQNLIRGMEYIFFNIDENGSIRKVDNIGKSDYCNYLLCSAEKAAYLKLV
ncbi:MAG TPA: FkbM family methyltransferase [Chitinophagaceae bacterium]